MIDTHNVIERSPDIYIFIPSFSSDVFQGLRAMQKIVRVGFRYNPPLVRLLHEILVALFLSKVDSVVFGFEIQMSSL